MSMFFNLIKKDFSLMLSSKFFLLAIGSLMLYSLYINLFYINIDQEIYPVYFYSEEARNDIPNEVILLNNLEELESVIADKYSVGIIFENSETSIKMLSSGSDDIDNLRGNYALALFNDTSNSDTVEVVGDFNKESKSRREITAEFLFFEITAVGFLGIASMLFKEKSMGAIKLTGILPINMYTFIFSKLGLILLVDIAFISLLSIINLGFIDGIKVLPLVLLNGCILSIIMTLLGFICSIKISDFKQFSLFYLVFAVFITTPVFLAGQTNVNFSWINFNPMYHLFMSMKNAYFEIFNTNILYYVFSIISIILLFILAKKTLIREMER